MGGSDLGKGGNDQEVWLAEVGIWIWVVAILDKRVGDLGMGLGKLGL